MSKIDLLDWLVGGTLRSDGAADQVADAVLIELVLFEDLLEGLKSEDDVVRTRVRYALETLMNPQSPFPKTWIKSPQVQKLIE